tara:strand:- start:560 stop:739 length:180 start_codon:yes stop_codon:yes gene_type:complete
MSSVDLDDEREEEAVCILQLIIFFALRRRSREIRKSLLSSLLPFHSINIKQKYIIIIKN